MRRPSPVPDRSTIRATTTCLAVVLVAITALATPASARPLAGLDDVATASTSVARWQLPRDLADAARGTARFHNPRQATRVGFARPTSGPLHECIGMDNDGDPRDDAAAMGFHWVHGERVGDVVLDPARPEVLVYEPGRHGRLHLVALEYVVFEEAWVAAHGPHDRPQLFGRPMIYTPAPNRYQLPAFYQRHVWLWEHNPAGLFESMSPDASCRFADRVE